MTVVSLPAMAKEKGAGSRPRVRDRSTDAEQRIFAATERLLAKQTARDLSVAQILEEAKIARGTFYHYFSSKWEVIIALATSVMEDIHGWVELFSGGGEPPRDEALRKAVEEGGRIWAEHRAVLRAIVEHWREVPEIRKKWLQVMERYISEIAEEIDRDRKAGIAPPGPDSRVLAGALMWSTANTLYMAGLDEAKSLPSEEAVLESLYRLWRGAIFG
jgi:TetR/AcrR family transcriptional regulator, ethionamide resistance regulator